MAERSIIRETLLDQELPRALGVGDGRAVTLRAGDVFHEPADTVITRFDATDEGVTFLGYFLLDDGRSPEITFVD